MPIDPQTLRVEYLRSRLRAKLAHLNTPFEQLESLHEAQEGYCVVCYLVMSKPWLLTTDYRCVLLCGRCFFAIEKCDGNPVRLAHHNRFARHRGRLRRALNLFMPDEVTSTEEELPRTPEQLAAIKRLRKLNARHEAKLKSKANEPQGDEPE